MKIQIMVSAALTAGVALCAQTAADVETSDYRAPYKLGLPIIAPSGTPGAFDQLAVDHPRLFVHDGRFYLSYLGYDGISYQTALAVSDDLLHWERVGMVFTRNQSTNNWDRLGRVVSSYLTPCDFRKNPELTRYKGRYWLFYHAYPGEGYEVRRTALRGRILRRRLNGTASTSPSSPLIPRATIGIPAACTAFAPSRSRIRSASTITGRRRATRGTSRWASQIPKMILLRGGGGGRVGRRFLLAISPGMPITRSERHCTIPAMDGGCAISWDSATTSAMHTLV